MNRKGLRPKNNYIINNMKYITLSVLLFACICSGSVFANKKDKKQEISSSHTAVLPLVSEIDSISYAFGISICESGLSHYLQQLGVIQDTASINNDYYKRIESAANEAEKGRLSSELAAKLDSVAVINNNNRELFFKGVLERLQSKDTNIAYISGLEVGAKLLDMSNRFAEEALDRESKLNYLALFEGIKDYLNAQPLFLNGQLIMDQKIYEAKARTDKMKEEEYAETIAAGSKFMAENSLNPGVVSLENGLQYKVITQGTGPKPTLSDQVKVHYKGTLIDGTVFDSSIDRGEPITFHLTGVIKGWTEILQLMPVGSKWMVYIPYDLAYGSRDTGRIKPYSNLIFEIELLEIIK